MKSSELRAIRKDWLIRHHRYSFCRFDSFNYDILHNIMYLYRPGKNHGEKYNDCIIMADTETSKEVPGTVCKNYVVAWTVSIRAFGMNIVTLYGQKPSDFIKCINQIMLAMRGDMTVIYFHNMSYDYVFLRKFMFREWGTPIHQLNVKPHYPLFIQFANGLVFKDSLILAQRGLEKWAKDMDVEHQKAVGAWDYEAKRNQSCTFTDQEKTYIEHDTLAGVECLQKTMDVLNKRIYSMPFTATGIPRENVQKLAAKNRGRDAFKKIVPKYETQEKLENAFHGGYTHNNRHYIERIIDGKKDGRLIYAYDFASSYPFCMLAYKYPMERFMPFENCKPDFILANADEYAYLFKLILIKPKLKDDFIPMPALQKSKCVKTVNAIEDNGRILCAAYAEIYLNEIDLEVIMQQYDHQGALCVEVEYAMKDYLPKWFTDYIYQCFVDKTMLKGGDPVAYSIAKSKLNSLYGMCVQKPVKALIEENYQTGDFKVNDDKDPAELYQEYVNRYTSVLPYQWGVWVTSYAFRNLFRLGDCAGVWLYSDTDSCYGQEWDTEKIAAYNEECKRMLTERGYGAVHFNGREYWLGIAELDGVYENFISVGAKRYAVRYADTKENQDDGVAGKLKITVAGVPKKGAACLKDDLHYFHAGFIFDGLTTGKKQHTYFFEEDITTDPEGNERGDSIDLSPADYKLDSVRSVDWETIFYEDIEVQSYEEDDIL